jgi:hypothetical protein
MGVEYRAGPRLIAGIFPRSGIELTLTDPWSNASKAVSGSKPEHGPGGFEVMAPELVEYTLAFLDEAFSVQMRDGITFVSFTEVELPTPGPEPEPKPKPEPEPEPEPQPEPEREPDPVPQPEPEPEPEPKPVPGPGPDPTAQQWAALFQRLMRIEELISKLPERNGG